MQALESFSLKNGLKVVYINVPHIQSVAFSFRGLAGSNYENSNQTGIAHFLEHLVFNGTKNFKTQTQLDEYIESVGGQSNAHTGHEHVQYQVKLLEKDIERGFLYLSEIALHPLLRQKDIKKEQSVIIQEIHRFKDSVEMYVPRALYKLQYPNHRLGQFITGEEEDIPLITQKHIEDFREKTYRGKGFALAVCTKQKREVIEDMANQYFGNMSSEKVTPLETPSTTKKLNITVENRSNINQAVLALSFYGYTYGDKQVYAQKIISYLLGEGTLSRLFQTLRDKQGLAYVVASYVASGSNFGNFNIYVGLAEKNAQKALTLIKKEIDKLVEKGITAQELERVKNIAVAGFTFGFEESSDIAAYYSHNALFKPELKTHYDELERFKSVTQEDINIVTRKLFTQEPKILVVAKDLNEKTLNW